MTNVPRVSLLLLIVAAASSISISSAFVPASRVVPRASISRLNDASSADTGIGELVGAAEQAAASAADTSSIASMAAESVAQSAPVEPVLLDLPAAVAPALDLDVVALVCGQENYGLAVVALGEALWSFLQAPSADHALKTFGPAAVAAVILVAVSGPMVTSGDPASVTLGLEIATGVSTLLGLSYLARLLAPYSPSPKEIAFLGLLVSLAGFFSFSQNLVVDGFIALPGIPLPQLPSFDIDLSFFNFD
mmetsp:Transcript_12800/g.21352  ORF Transcript_12800/g.21352 Transcript_12800/m.21352 type:complete len:249 (-) Transcript_12800:64-810(-)